MNMNRSHRLALIVAFASACGSDSPAGDSGSSTGGADSSGTNVSSSLTNASGVDGSSGDPSTTLTTTAGEASATTDAASSSGGAACTVSSECGDPFKPICDDGVCVACDDDQQCAELDPTAPACRADGACVLCTAGNDSQCGGSTPWCDESVSACAPCGFHEHCPDSACRISTGTCFDEAEVYRVGPGEDFTDLPSAVATLGDGEYVLRLTSIVSGSNSTTISGAGAVYAIIADDPTMPPYLGFGGGTTLRVEEGAEVYVQDALFAVILGNQPMIVANAASLYFDRVRVLSYAHGGLRMDNGAYALLRTSTITQLDSAYPAVAAMNSDVDVAYSTFAAFTNDGSAAFSCASTTASSIRNSIVVSDGPGYDLICDGATVSHTATNAVQRGTENVMLGAFDDAWFVGYTNGDLALSPDAPAELLTAAVWLLGDPVTDIDGDARPLVDGAVDVAGADVP